MSIVHLLRPRTSLLLFLSFLSGGFSPESGSADVLVLTSSLPSYSFAVNLLNGVDGFHVEKILGDPVEPHDYHLLPSDMRTIGKADLLILVGAGFDDWLRKPFENNRHSGGTDRQIDLSDAVQADLLKGADQGKHERYVNPHYWLDPLLSIRCVSFLAEKLSLLYSDQAEKIRENASSYQKKLEELNVEMTGILLPLRGKAIITQHDAFPYFAQRFGIVIAEVIEDISGVPPGPGKIGSIYRAAREKEIVALCYEPGDPSKLLRQLSKDLRVNLVQLAPLGNGASVQGAYIRGMRGNALSLVKKAP